VADDKWGRQFHDAIARRDAAALRRMAVAADREEGRMWLTLLARMLEVDAARRRRQAMRLCGLAILPTTRRITLRRSV
jgi:hypothetical protein